MKLIVHKKHFKSVVQIRGNTTFDMYSLLMTPDMLTLVQHYIATSAFDLVDKEVFFAEKCQVTTEVQMSKGMSINKSARAWNIFENQRYCQRLSGLC